MPNNRLPEDLRQLRGRDFCLGGHEVHHLGQLVHEHDDRVVALAGLRQLRDEIHRHLLPRMVGDGQRLQQARRDLLRRLVALTSFASPDILEDIGVHSRPVESPLDLLEGLVLAQVPRGGHVVALVEESRSQRCILRDVEPIRIAEVYQTSSHQQWDG